MGFFLLTIYILHTYASIIPPIEICDSRAKLNKRILEEAKRANILNVHIRLPLCVIYDIVININVIIIIY